MGKQRPKPTWITPLVIALVTATALASVLPLTHVTNKPGTPTRTNSNTLTSIGSPINISLNTPVYVIGPQSLTQRLVGVGVPQSLIKPIGLNQLPSLPNNSIAIIDWSAIKPYIAYSTVNRNTTLNLTSPAVDLLTSLITKGDLVILYGNTSNLPTMEYLLAYTWARKYGILASSEYLIALPTIPVGSKDALAAAFGGPYYLVIWPVMPRYMVKAIMTYTALKHLPVSKAQTGGAGLSFSMIKANLQSSSSSLYPEDVCGYIYSQYYQNAASVSSGVYESSNSYFIWLLPMLNWYGTLDNGVQGYSDGNGTFYYDTCLEVSTQVIVAAPSYVPLYVYGYVSYDPTSTMTNNGGEVLSETGTIDYYTSYEYYNESITNSIIAGPASTANVQPQPTSSTTSYSISVPSGSESISLNYGPSTQAYGYPAGNVTWTFNLNNANTPNDNYYNDFEDPTPNWIMPNFSSSQQSAYLPVYMSAKVMTSSQIVPIGSCDYYNNTYEYIWVDGGWWLFAQPKGSSTGLTSASYGFYEQSGYVSGVTSWSTLEPFYCEGPP
ncbi:MAG: hypothetical protein RXO22_08380 [Thermocladium sp.]